ncbi:MAG: SPASM domain-containing protein [Clostridiales bacterium]|nr:SPASM domain-containing protein [Clostridiales bacterium]
MRKQVTIYAPAGENNAKAVDLKLNALLELCRNASVETEVIYGYSSETEVTCELFDRWLISGDPAETSCEDLLKLVILKERNGCEHNSCLGKVLSIDSAGMVYWCKHNKPKTALGSIGEIKTLSDCFSNKVFEKHLDAHYKKRETCKSTCKHFELCLGGCPLRCDLDGHCTEQEFIEIAEHALSETKRFIKLGDLSLLNKQARAIVLNAVAHAPFSELFSGIYGIE